jgi:hypothetical protein
MMRLRRRERMLIESGWLVRVLVRARAWHHCRGCGSRMFVKGSSGLCPVCFSQRQRQIEGVQQALEQLAPPEAWH